MSVVAAGGMAAAAVLALIGGFPLDMPMPTHRFGLVDPTCGLTRGSTAIARGDLGLAWRYNPASLLVMGFGLLGVGRWLAGLVTGQWVSVRLRPGRAGWLALGIGLLALWAYQQAHADFVMHARL
jgi:hypothetical protein